MEASKTTKGVFYSENAYEERLHENVHVLAENEIIAQGLHFPWSTIKECIIVTLKCSLLT